jgi:hypothetical protein
VGGRVTINATLNGLPQGTITLGPITISPTTANLTQDENFTLQMGQSAIDVPSWAVGCIIIPNPTNTVPMMVATVGVGNEGSVGLSASAPSLISFPSPPPAALSFIVTSAVTTTTTVTFF